MTLVPGKKYKLKLTNCDTQDALMQLRIVGLLDTTFTPAQQVDDEIVFTATQSNHEFYLVLQDGTYYYLLSLQITADCPTLEPMQAYRYKYNGKELLPRFGGQYDYGFRMYNAGLGRFLSVDPLGRLLPFSSPYIGQLNNPIILVDPDGRYPIYFISRTFAPFASFGPRNLWHGDNRSATLDRSASYRSLVSILHDTKSKKTEVFGGHSRSYTLDNKKDAVSPTLFSNRSRGKAIDVHSYGKNDAQMGSFDIDQFTKFRVTTEGDLTKSHILNISGTISGDDFPNHESMIYDNQGNGIWLGSFETSGNRMNGPIVNLPLENEDQTLIKVAMRISVNNQGIFQGVVVKDSNGKDSIVSIDEWNKSKGVR